jgi:hypothetical protein
MTLNITDTPRFLKTLFRPNVGFTDSDVLIFNPFTGFPHEFETDLCIVGMLSGRGGVGFSQNPVKVKM